MYSRGATILEICIGMMVVLPAFIIIVSVAAYLNTIRAARSIALEMTRSLDMPAFRTTIGNQDAWVNSAFSRNSPNIPNLAMKLYEQSKNFNLPNKTKRLVLFANFMVPVNVVTGKADLSVLDLPWNSPNNHNGRTPITRGYGDRIFFNRDEVKEEYLVPIKDMIDRMRNRHKTPYQGSFPFAIPSSLKGLSQASYLGSSHIYKKHPTEECDLEELTQEQFDACEERNNGWVNFNEQSNFLRRAPVVAVSVFFDLTETGVGSMFSTIEKYSCTILRSPRVCNQQITPKLMMVNATSFVELRKVL